MKRIMFGVATGCVLTAQTAAVNLEQYGGEQDSQIVMIDQSRSCFGGGNKLGGIGAAVAKMFGEGLGLKPNEEA